MTDDDHQKKMRETLDGLAGRVRHPALELDRFTDDVDDDPELLWPDQRRRAERRRACVMYAADLVVDQVLQDLAEVEWNPDTGRPVPGTVEDTLVWTRFPQRFRAGYDGTFFRRVAVCAVTVGYDLARPDGDAAACTAEELVRHIICDIADEVAEIAGLEHGWCDLPEMLLEDLDFLDLYDASMDGIEHDPATQRSFDRTSPPVQDWFAPFNDERIVHPYAETEETGPKEHDLMLRVRGGTDAFDRVQDPALLDDPAHVAPFPATSDAVEQARALEATASDAGGEVWVADSSAPQSSFAELARIAGDAAEAGSGWLTWEPHEGADTVRTDGVVQLRAHRHFPVGEDVPWACVSFGGVMMAIPLTAVVSYRPDPAIRRAWNSAFSSPGDHDGDRATD